MNKDIISLSIPKKPKYISIARLAISGLSYEVGLSIGDIEDLKICIGEACINVLANSENDSIDMEFEVKSDKVYIRIKDVEEKIKEDDKKKQYGLLIIESLMDKVSFTQEGIEMMKYFKDDIDGDE